ncbi:endonuclease/exonuclease/phosphatase family protein [Micromonospora sp. NPDC003197]
MEEVDGDRAARDQPVRFRWVSRSSWRSWGRDARGRSGWSRGRIIALLAGLVACLLVFHRAVPNVVGHLGSLLETFLPWLGLTVPVLLGLALLRRSIVGLVALLLPIVAWFSVFGGLLPPHANATYDIVVLQHNVSDENADPAGTTQALLKVQPDLIALVELTPPALPTYAAILASDYPYYTVHGTVGLWSRQPIADARLLDIRPTGVGTDWNRGLRATVRMPTGDVAVYVAHLPSVRLGITSGFNTARRDESAALLGAAIAAEPLDRVILLGDLNSTVDDRGLHPVSSRLTSAESGFAFSWPAAFPVARIDQVMTRAATVIEIWSLPATGSDHLPIAARLRF